MGKVAQAGRVVALRRGRPALWHQSLVPPTPRLCATLGGSLWSFRLMHQITAQPHTPLETTGEPGPAPRDRSQFPQGTSGESPQPVIHSISEEAWGWREPSRGVSEGLRCFPTRKCGAKDLGSALSNSHRRFWQAPQVFNKCYFDWI